MKNKTISPAPVELNDATKQLTAVQPLPIADLQTANGQFVEITKDGCKAVEPETDEPLITLEALSENDKLFIKRSNAFDTYVKRCKEFNITPLYSFDQEYTAEEFINITNATVEGCKQLIGEGLGVPFLRAYKPTLIRDLKQGDAFKTAPKVDGLCIVIERYENNVGEIGIAEKINPLAETIGGLYTVEKLTDAVNNTSLKKYGCVFCLNLERPTAQNIVNDYLNNDKVKAAKEAFIAAEKAGVKSYSNNGAEIFQNARLFDMIDVETEEVVEPAILVGSFFKKHEKSTVTYQLLTSANWSRKGATALSLATGKVTDVTPNFYSQPENPRCYVLNEVEKAFALEALEKIKAGQLPANDSGDDETEND